MNRSVNDRKTVLSVLSLIVAAVLVFGIFPMPEGTAASDNPGESSIEFPSAGSTDTVMECNYGTITLLYRSGTVNDNCDSGFIDRSNGTVLVNHGTINTLGGGYVGTNEGTVELITNTGSVTVNDDKGKITTNLNVIGSNYGHVEKNHYQISDNYGTVGINTGTVVMRDGTVRTNSPEGKIRFEYKIISGETIPAKGSVENNNGTIEINNAAVSVKNNTGTIILKNDAVIECTNNYGTIVKEDGCETYTCRCQNNFGTIGFDVNSDGKTYPAVMNYYKIVFEGDGGNASVAECEAEYNGTYYTMRGSMIVFKLPEGYGCKGASGDPKDPTQWFIVSEIEENKTVCTLTCHLCSAGSYSHDDSGHRQYCTECGTKLTEGSHTYTEFSSDNNATCSSDGTRSRTCTVCDHVETVTDEGSHITSEKHNPVTDPRVEPTETSTGLTEGSHCADCGKILTAQQILPMIQKDTDPSGENEGSHRAEGGSSAEKETKPEEQGNASPEVPDPAEPGSDPSAVNGKTAEENGGNTSAGENTSAANGTAQEKAENRGKAGGTGSWILWIAAAMAAVFCVILVIRKKKH